MALFGCEFHSEALSQDTSMTVLLPQSPSRPVGSAHRSDDVAGAPPVLYLLHGLGDDDTAWLRQTSIERYVADLGLAVVMPQVHRSFYTDGALGGRYWTFLSEELPALVSRFFRVSGRREDTFVAGLSMGGYGAFKWALRAPERFAAAASLSGALDVAGLRTVLRPEDPRMFERIFGPDSVEPSEDLLRLVAGVDPLQVPPLLLCCGTEDELLASNTAFQAACTRAGVDLQAEFGPGDHDWAYWDLQIQRLLRWLPLRPRTGV